ncbi:hypothetical protein P3S68_027348 [Capsicum galapagoense]
MRDIRRTCKKKEKVLLFPPPRPFSPLDLRNKRERDNKALSLYNFFYTNSLILLLDSRFSVTHILHPLSKKGKKFLFPPSFSYIFSCFIPFSNAVVGFCLKKELFGGVDLDFCVA